MAARANATSANGMRANAPSANATSTTATNTNATRANQSRSGAPYQQPVAPAAAAGYAVSTAAASTRERPAERKHSSADDERWHVQVAAGDVRVVTLDKLDDLYRYDVVDENAFVWQPGMSNWIKLGTLLEAAEETAAPAPIYVQLSPDNIKPVTLEQLGDYYRYGTVDGSTLVWTAATNEWTSLAQALGQGSLASAQASDQADDDEPEDPFFVLFGPGDVREITLEQLDDYYRYGVISESTMLWQKGMGEWQSLGKVAGIEETPEPIRNAPEPRLAPTAA
ncbi:MAG TPA: GYF domain-containing protein, partial [Polyangiaceae bacterium]